MTNRNPFQNPSQEFVYMRTYARWNDELKRRETWPETVDRYFNWMKDRFGDKVPAKVFEKTHEAVLKMGVLPSMRALWAAGPALTKNNITGYNCCVKSITDLRAIAEVFYVMMCGTGVGFSVENQYISQLPAVEKQTGAHAGTFVVEDSREGWADALLYGLEIWLAGADVDFDFSKIRPKGARLKTMGGRASGPRPLEKMLDQVRDVILKAQGRRLKDVEILDICNMTAVAVVVGSVRRSAQISFSDLNSESMRHAKDFPFPDWRYMSNNAAVYSQKPDMITFMSEWSALAKSGSGERGIFNLQAANKMSERRKSSPHFRTNPCQPGFATVFGKDANGNPIIKTFDQLQIGDDIWTGTKWTVVTNKVYTGDSFVFGYHTPTGVFVGTENHKVFQNGVRIEAGHAVGIDTCMSPFDSVSKSWSKERGYRTPTLEYITSVVPYGILPVYDITVADEEHCYWTGGLKVSNCGEIVLNADTGEFCNLTSVVMRPSDTFASLTEKVKSAVWLGTMQACLTDFPWIRLSFKERCEEERLLGVSLSGQMDCQKFLTPSRLDDLKEVAVNEAKKASKTVGINMPAAITCVKPEGTSSELTNASAGAHLRYAPYYIRRYRISATDALFRLMKDQGVPFTAEVGQRERDFTRDGKKWSEDEVLTWVVEFPIKAPAHAVFRNEMSAIDQLEHYLMLQKHWCEHNTSISVYVKPDEWLKVGSFIYDHFDEIVAVSCFPYEEHGYELAPFEEITKETYEKLIKSFPNIDYSVLSVYELEDEGEGSKELACGGGGCMLK